MITTLILSLLVISEFEDFHDKRLLWDLLKYRIRQSTIVFSQQKAKQRRNKLVDIENKLRKSELLCATEPTENSVENIEKGKIKYDSMYEYTTQGTLYDTEPHGMKKVKKQKNKKLHSIPCFTNKEKKFSTAKRS